MPYLDNTTTTERWEKNTHTDFELKWFSHFFFRETKHSDKIVIEAMYRRNLQAAAAPANQLNWWTEQFIYVYTNASEDKR